MEKFTERYGTTAYDEELFNGFMNEEESLKRWVLENWENLRQNKNDGERMMAKILHYLKHEFVYQAPFVFHAENKHRVYFADFYLPKLKTVIEIDGPGHITKDGKEKDIQRDQDFLSIGISTVRVPLHRVSGLNFIGIEILGNKKITRKKYKSIK